MADSEGVEKEREETVRVVNVKGVAWQTVRAWKWNVKRR
jgi:hypothetical protein